VRRVTDSFYLRFLANDTVTFGGVTNACQFVFAGDCSKQSARKRAAAAQRLLEQAKNGARTV
jgi:hypothetical protein